MSVTWKTKYGLRRVRHDPPTIAEALAAARGMTDDREQQVQFAAELMGVDEAEARAELKKCAPEPKTSMTIIPSSRDRGPRVVVVERKASRRMVAKPLGKPGVTLALRTR